MSANAIVRLLILSMVTALACEPATAQSSKDSRRSRQDKVLSQRDYDEQQNALQTLLYLRNNAFEIDNPADRVRVLVEIGDALWLVDKEEAKEVFRQSFTRAAEFNDSAEPRSTSSQELKQLVITRVAKRDPALAKSLLLTVTPPDKRRSDEFADLYGNSAGASEMLVKAAAEILPTDTNQAVQMASLSLPNGMSQQMRLFLLALRARDRVAADAFFEFALRTASSRRPKQLVEALFLWDYAFQRPTIYLGPVSWFRPSPVEYPVALELKRRVLGFAVEAVVETAAQFYLAAAPETERPLILERYVLLQSVAAQILPDVERLLPSATESLLAQLSRMNQELREQGRKLPGPPEPLPKSPDVQASVDKLIERAGNASKGPARDGLYAKAALRLYLHGDYERAIAVARNVEDLSLRLKLTEPIRFDWAGDLISRGQLDEAERIARDVETLELRVVILARLAAACLENKTTQARGIAVLNEAESAINKANPSGYLVSAVVAVARVYLQLNDRNQAKASTSSAIRLINAIEEGSGWSFFNANDKSERLSVQDAQWTSRRDGGLNSLTVVYPRPAGLLDVLSEISESNLSEGLMLARQLKQKGLNYAAQALLCRRTIERVQRNNSSLKTSSARDVLE